MAEEPRAAVLDNMFMGSVCNIKRPQSTTLYHRVPHNFANFDIKVFLVWNNLYCSMKPDLSYICEIESEKSSNQQLFCSLQKINSIINSKPLKEFLIHTLFFLSRLEWWRTSALSLSHSALSPLISRSPLRQRAAGNLKATFWCHSFSCLYFSTQRDLWIRPLPRWL